MPITIVVGGQYGSEGKGKVSAFFAEKYNAKYVVRVGGSNSGHTVYNGDGKRYALRQLPTASVNDFSICVIPAGSYIDVNVLLSEILLTEIQSERLKIDPYATIITEQDSSAESSLTELIASTSSGTGASLINRVSRSGNVTFAKDIPQLTPYITKTKELLRSGLESNERVIIEGTQGYGLSILHSDEYPYVTSRDTTAAGFLSETGLSPLDVDDIILVIRSYPIRVSGNSGPFKNEITWEQVSKLNSGMVINNEYTTVTNKLRRVAQFDPMIVKDSIQANNPTVIVLNHVDYLPRDKRMDAIKRIEGEIGKDIDYIGTDPYGIVPND